MTDTVERVARVVAAELIICGYVSTPKKAGLIARAAIAAMQEWRDIESAPRDGSKFDVWYQDHEAPIPDPAHRIIDVYWSKIQDCFCTDGQYGPEEPQPLSAYPQPTHWMLVPAPPEDSK